MAEERAGDDSTIPDDALLWRRIPPWHVVVNQNTGGRMVSSAAFDDDDDSPMSVTLADASADPQGMLAGHTEFGLVAFSAGLARSIGLAIVRDPTDADPAHALVIGKKRHSVRRNLRNGSTWVIRPPGWDDVSLA